MICINCNKEYEPPKQRGRKSPYCCEACKTEYQKIHRKTYTRVCGHCGTEFESVRRNQKYCSTECSHAASKTGRTVYTKTCLYCGKEFHTTYKDRKYCTSTCAARHAGDQRKGEYFCEYCGKPRYSDHPNRNRFCSRECAIKYRMIQYLPTKIAKEKAVREKREQELTKVCPNCGVVFIAGVQHQRFCSYQCQYEASLTKSHNDYVMNYIPRVFTCAECGKEVITVPNDRIRVFCSEECCNKNWKRIYKRNREKQVREAFVENVDLWSVYNRDEGICAICGLPVPDINDPANVWSPTVDHIVPLSVGGSHSYHNCQLSHRLCNCFKGQETKFVVDWTQKLAEEPGRWNESLDKLWEMLGEDVKSIV